MNLSLAWTQAATSAGSSIYVLEDTGTGWKSLSGSGSGTGISGSQAAEEPTVAFAGGSLYVAWAANTDGTNNIVAAMNSGSAWQSLTIQTPISAGVNQISRGIASDPVLAAHGSSLELVWFEDRLPGTPDQAVAIYADQLAGGAFVSQLPGDSSFDGILGRSTSLSQPASLSLAVDGAGHPFVVWGDSSSGSSQVYLLGDALNIAKIIYVNDSTGPDDSYTTEPGKASGNTGLTPNSPLSSISAALAARDSAAGRCDPCRQRDLRRFHHRLGQCQRRDHRLAGRLDRHHRRGQCHRRKQPESSVDEFRRRRGDFQFHQPLN